MKLNNFKYIALLCASMGVLTSCEDFLDRQEDEVLTFEKIWENKNTVKQYFYNAMSFMPDYNTASTEKPWFGASDEGSVSFSGNPSFDIIYGKWNPSSYAGEYAKYYKGIRECNIFLANIDNCSDPYLREDERNSWKGSVKWVRAYYYFLLMRDYGPVILLYDEIPDPTTPDMTELARSRNSWDECVAYVEKELNDLVKEDWLDYNDWSYDDRKGLPTKGAAKALLSRLKLYSARPLFNGCDYYKDVANKDGKKLFPQSPDYNKWREAADAAYRVISEENYKLYYADKSPNDPYANWKELNISGANWNSEVIYGLYNTCNFWARRATPSTPTLHGFTGVAPTQEQVDAYAMKNGRFPILGYEEDGTPIIDPVSGYDEEGTSDYVNPYSKWKGIQAKYQGPVSGEWPNMYKDREPRFYMSVFWSNSYWIYNRNKTEAVSMAKGGNSYNTHNYSLTGYTMIKYVDSNYDHSNSKYNATVFSHFRLAEVYMNFVESVLECKKHGVEIPADYETKAFECWKDLRSRVDIPDVQTAYPEVSPDDYDKWIDLCHRERRVEFVGEHLRYYDNRTLMTSEKFDKGYVHGMNVEAPAPSSTGTPDEFWQRTKLQERIFYKNYYLAPIPQNAIIKNSELIQNKGW